MLGVESLLVTLVVATRADPYPLKQDWKSHGKKTTRTTKAPSLALKRCMSTYSCWWRVSPNGLCAPPLPHRRIDSAHYSQFVFR